jgi:hypothetical protein
MCQYRYTCGGTGSRAWSFRRSLPGPHTNKDAVRVLFPRLGNEARPTGVQPRSQVLKFLKTHSRGLHLFSRALFPAAYLVLVSCYGCEPLHSLLAKVPAQHFA